MPPTPSPAFLELQNVKTHFPVQRGVLFQRLVGTVRAVDGVSLSLRQGEILGLVGESGCGKSTLGRTIVQLLAPTEGAVILAGRHLQRLTGRELREARAQFQMIFQDPYASLNPRMTIYDALAEAIGAHQTVARQATPGRVAELMKSVGLEPRFMRKYPHEFSGGQRQRIAIARALAVQPSLIVADEPVSALDVSIQAQIINLLAGLCRERGLTLLFISHDLSVVKHISDRIAVMYLGRIVELGPSERVVEQPLHPYTQALISAVPLPDPARERLRRRILLQGDPPSPLRPPAGCPFHPRCPHAVEKCRELVPALEEYIPSQVAACIRVPELMGQGSGTVMKG
jgi:oligopeptide transport system ATP-binding protein